MMKRSTPVILGVLLILGVVALGYFSDLENHNNNSTNNTTSPYSFLKFKNLNNQTQDNPQSQPQQASSNPTSNDNTNQNSTNNETSQNITASST